MTKTHRRLTRVAVIRPVILAALIAALPAAAILGAQPVLAQNAAPAKPPASPSQKVDRLVNNVVNNVVSIGGGDDLKLAVHGGCGALQVFGLDVDKNCMPSTALDGKSTSERIDAAFGGFAPDLEKAYATKPAVLIEHLSCGTARALGLQVSASCLQGITLALVETAVEDPSSLLHPSDFATAVTSATQSKVGTPGQEIFRTAVIVSQDALSLMPKGKIAKGCLDLAGDAINLACESDIPTDVVIRSVLDPLNPDSHAFSMNPTTMGPPGSVSCVGGYCAAPLPGSSTTSASAGSLPWSSSNPFRSGSLGAGTGDACRVGDVCPVTIIDPNKPAPHFADGSAAPKDWPNCDPGTGLCGSVIIQDGSLRPGSSSTVDAGTAHMSSLPDDPLEQTTTTLSSHLGPDCELNPYQSGCDLPQSKTSLEDMLAGASCTPGSWGGSVASTTEHDAARAAIPGTSEGLMAEWDDGEEQ